MIRACRKAGSRLGALHCALTATLLAGCATSLQIRDRPISFSAARQEATLRYISEHYGLDPDDVSIVPRVIVLHWTAIDDFEESFQTFDSEMLGDTRPELAHAGAVNVSTHFLVDRDGTIFRLMPETWMARHVIGLNYAAIGVENVGGGDSIDNLSDAQLESNIRLVRHLAKKYPTVEYLIGHLEYQDFEGHPLWLEGDATYRTHKVDPGHRFMSAVRRGVADLELEGADAVRRETASSNP